MMFAVREPVFRDVKLGETNQPAQIQKTIRGMRSVHHNSNFLIFDFKIISLSFVYYIIQLFTWITVKPVLEATWNSISDICILN